MKKKNRNFLKKLVLNILYIRRLYILVLHDSYRYFKFSFSKSSSIVKIESFLSMYSHTIEKGLTMPNRRYRFGIDAIKKLVEQCNLYIELKYDLERVPIQHSVSVLLAYKEMHIKVEEQLDEKIVAMIDSLAERMNISELASQLDYTPDSYFEHVDSSFDIFSNSRHSVRNYTGEGGVNIEDIIRSVKLANNAPSSCNRQPSRIYIVDDKRLLTSVLEKQHGNRGFGECAEKILVLTADSSVYHAATQRNSPYIDGGMFAMNLLYALHFNKIAACTLNCYFNKKEDMYIRNLLNIPESEVFICIISLGKLPAEFAVASSKRNNFDSIFIVK